MRIYFFILILLGINPGTGFGQTNDVCTDCHSDPSLTGERLSGPVSLTVTTDSLLGTPHEKLACIDCHASLKGVEDFPHDAPKSVNCGACHQSSMKQYMEGFFNKLNEMGFRGIPACSDCHGQHRIAKKADTRRVCGLCHQAELKALNLSVHGQRNDKGGPLVCTSCHEPHFKTRRGQMSESQWQMSLVKGCTECHRHETTDYLDSRHYAAIQAGDTTAPNCIVCHGDHNILSHKNPAAPTSTERLDKLCTTCHTDYEATLHKKDGVEPRLMTCVACHTGHETQMQRVAGAGVVRETLPGTCNECHGGDRHDKEMLAHGKIMVMDKSGNGPANCTQCHVYHWKKQGIGHEASLRQQCQNCHVKETQEYGRSEHAQARAKGHAEAPTCQTCHGDAEIKTIKEGMRPRDIIDLCSKCHGNREMALKFQLSPDVVKSYKKTYHGQVYSLGYQGAEFATCVNCHGNHDIQTTDSPESLVSRQKIVQTCARCHKDANEKFVSFLSHYDPHGGEAGAMSPERNVSRAEEFMNKLLFVVFGFFGMHTILWFVREVVERRRHPQRVDSLPVRWIQRFNPWQRFLHLLMMSSFLLLASTGLPLKFSHSEIAYWIATNMVNLHVMAIAHRVGAVMTFTYFGLHIGTLLYLRFIKREKGIFWGPNSLVPNWQDAKDLFGHFKWFFGLGQQPRFGRWTYWEKFDYFAVFWGVAIIGSSGLVLWFPEIFTRILPGWTINLAHIVHSEEALLAVGFIFTVHFFNSHLRPGKFPLDPVIFTGRVSVHDLVHERPVEVELMKEYGGVEDFIVPDMPVWRRRLLLTIGWMGFTTGVILLAFIVSSVIL